MRAGAAMSWIGLGRMTVGASLALAALVLSGSGGCTMKDKAGRAGSADTVEITEYEGARLAPYFRAYDNSIDGPQEVDAGEYRLEIVGLVESPRSLTYDEVMALPRVTRAVTLYCVEGWEERLLFEGVRLADLLAPAGPKAGASTLILHSVDGYSTALPYDDVERLDLMLAAKINGKVLDAMRGFPFQLVAESKLGYKWIKWVSRIELSDEPYLGFWEQRGYSDDAEVPKARLEAD
jgi:DMSO/TMAO reductase YedYZ molybdopterin-dependent catalytic subunit